MGIITKLLGILSLGLAALIGYWLSSPTPALDADPLNSLVLIVFALVFLTSGFYLISYGYLLSGGDD